MIPLPREVKTVLDTLPPGEFRIEWIRSSLQRRRNGVTNEQIGRRLATRDDMIRIRMNLWKKVEVSNEP